MEEKEYAALEHINKLLHDPSVPKLEGESADIPLLKQLHDELKGIREIMFSFSMGDLSPDIRIRGIIPGCMKALQAHLRHLVWQVQQVEQGDFSQRVEFLGEFSAAFNNMVRQLDSSLNALQKKEEKLVVLTDNLRNEVNLKKSAMEALQESESRFKYLASHDPLTGALNRRSFMERVLNEIKDAQENSIPCCLVIMDIDFFKVFNDTYGHLAGDAALQQVVKIAAKVLRKNDFLGRYGGEEFIFFFNNADLDTGCAIADRIREAIASSPVILQNTTASISASFGVTGMPKEENLDETNCVQDLINTADKALYEAKRAGKNTVICISS
ncbi:diguanylate cyclase [Treponema sp. OttesenSCG-928-L16]|nr:diguanylate cyclase [Treponema sp. OttesenSCG-928-L16]